MTPTFVHEVRQILTSLRFALIFAGLTLLLALTALPAAARFRIELSDREAVGDAFGAALAESSIGSFTEERIPVVKPPWPLLFAVEGGQMAAPNRYDQKLAFHWIPRPARVDGGSSRLPAIPPLDWMLVIRVVLSLAAFVLCHDALAAEREAKNSRLVGSYPWSPGRLLRDKLLAYWVCLALPVMVGAAASALLFSARTGLPLLPVSAKLACLLALGLWVLALYVLVALCFASRIRDAATCLTVLLFVWVGGVVVMPAVADIAARRLVPVPSEVEVKRRLESLHRQVHEVEFEGRSERWRAPWVAVFDGYSEEKLSARADDLAFDRQEEYWRQVLDAQLDQARLARDLASVSPVYLLQNVAERLAGTGVRRERSFLEQARDYRHTLTRTVRDLDALDPTSPHVFKAGYLSDRPLPAGTIEAFSFREHTLDEGFAASWGGLLALAGQTFLLIQVTRRAFARRMG